LVAQHYTAAGCTELAIAYWQRAGQHALQRSANLEAVQHLTKGRALLAMLPETPARAQQELNLLIALGPALMATKGYATPEVEQTYARARALCQQVGEIPQLFPTLWGLWRFYEGSGALLTARELGEQLYRLAQHAAVPMHLLEAHNTSGSTLFFLGEYAAAWRHLEQGIALIDPTAQRALVLSHDMVPGVACLTVAALTLWCLGFPAHAVRRCQEALALSQALNHPQSLVRAQHYAAFLYHRRREAPAVQAQAEALAAMEERGRGESLAEAYRLQGAFLLQLATPDAAQAEACFQQAIAHARHQQPKSWELRAARRLSRLWQQQGKRAEARQLLTPIYGWFTEGFGTSDLQEAKALLKAL
jgi:predicted ATPase